MFRSLTLALVATTIACGSAQPGNPNRVSRDVITREELRAVQVSSAYEAIQRLRPEFLRARGSGGGSRSSSPIIVYVNGVRAGTLDVLRSLPASDVTGVRWVSAADATTLHGTGHSSGVIEVTTGH